MIRTLFFLAMLCAWNVASAAEHAASAGPSAASSLFQGLLGLVVVLGLLGATAWAIRRSGLARPVSASTVKIIGGASIGTRERIVLVEVAGQWIVVGIAPGCINALATMPRQEGIAPAETNANADAKNFATWLKQMIEKQKRNGQ
ncbi:MAG TPA: flagellar biosynthetic protein FliO [Noviherbaspirillum sp.]